MSEACLVALPSVFKGSSRETSVGGGGPVVLPPNLGHVQSIFFLRVTVEVLWLTRKGINTLSLEFLVAWMSRANITVSVLASIVTLPVFLTIWIGLIQLFRLNHIEMIRFHTICSCFCLYSLDNKSCWTELHWILYHQNCLILIPGFIWPDLWLDLQPKILKIWNIPEPN